MTAFLGLDIAANTGWALLEPIEGRKPRVSCGSWKCPGRDYDEKCAALSNHLVTFYKEQRGRGIKISECAIEEPLRTVPIVKGKKSNDMFASEPTNQLASNAGTILTLAAMNGAAVAIMRAYRIPWEIVRPATWRKSFIGHGYAPRGTPNGRQWLKHRVREHADRIGDEMGFNVPNMDASDAVGIVMWLAAMRRYDQAIKAMAA